MSIPALKAIGHFGWVGVDLFFVLSGYLIGGQLFRQLRAKGEISLSSFYIRRGFRILPCFLVVLAAYLVWPGFREKEWSVPLWRFLTFTQNFGLHFSAFSHAWSLCIEEQFYWLFPLTVLLASRSGRWRVIAVIFGVFAFGMAYRGWVWSQDLGVALSNHDRVVAYYKDIYYPTFGRLDGLTVGVSIALLTTYCPELWKSLSRFGNGLTLAGIALVAGALACFEHQYALLTVIFAFPLLSLGFGCLVASAASESSLLARAYVPGTGTLAVLAYTIYLTHKQVIHLAADYGVAFTACAILGTSVLLHLLIEKPSLKLRDLLSRQRSQNISLKETVVSLMFL